MAVLNGERMHDTMERLLPGARSGGCCWWAGRGSAWAARRWGRTGLRRGCAVWAGAGHRLPAVYCLAAALGTLAAGAGVPADAAGR